ncbi:thermonuclease [bacterium]|nr:thermonuclease [bacterium]
MKRWVQVIPIFFLAAAPIFGGVMGVVTENAVAIGVTDGDTIRVEIGDKRESVRLIGVDTPESRRNEKLMHDVYRTKRDVNTILEMGQEATEYTKSLVKAKDPLVLEYDVQKRDRYRRILAYVYLKDGRMLNEELVKSGHAMPLTIPPNVKYQGKFLKAYRETRGR